MLNLCGDARGQAWGAACAALHKQVDQHRDLFAQAPARYRKDATTIISTLDRIGTDCPATPNGQVLRAIEDLAGAGIEADQHATSPSN